VRVDEEYVRKQLRQTEHEHGESLKSLRWDAAVLRKVFIVNYNVSLNCPNNEMKLKQNSFGTVC